MVYGFFPYHTYIGVRPETTDNINRSEFPHSGKGESLGDLNRLELSLPWPVVAGQGRTTLIPPKATISQLFSVFSTLCSLIGRYKCYKGLLRNQDTRILILSFFFKLFSSVQFTQSCPSFCYPMNCSTPGLPVHHQLSEFTQAHAHWVGNAIQPSHSQSSPSPPAFSLSQHQGLFQWVSSLHQVAKVLEFQLQHQSFQWIFRTNFLRMDWLDLLAVQGTLKSLFQYQSWRASNLWCSAFFILKLSHPSMATGKTIALTRWTFVGKVMFLLFNKLSRVVITFLPRSKRLFVSYLQSPSAVILEPNKIKSVTLCIVSPSIFHEVMGPDTMILVFWMLSFKPTFSLSSFTFIKRLFSSS